MKNNTGCNDSTQKKIVTIPNMLSVFRLCLIPLFVWLYCGKQEYMWTAGVLVLSGLTDTLDGFVARHFNMNSDVGKVLDPVADKLTQAAMLFCLCTRFPLMVIPLALMLVKELFMGVTGLMVIKRTGNVYGAIWHGKVVTCLLYAMMILHVVWYDIPIGVSNFFVGCCTIMMIISLILYGLQNLKVLKEEETR